MAGSKKGCQSLRERKITSLLRPLAHKLAAAAMAGCLPVISSGAWAQDADLAALNAKASGLDGEDYRFVQPVCTRCHTPEMFLHSRSWSGWRDIFNQMSGYG